MRPLIAAAIASAALAACDQEAPPEPDISPPPEPILTIEAGGASPMIFSVAVTEAPELQISGERGTAQISLSSAFGTPLWNPVAMMEIPDTADASARRVYIACAGAGRDQGRGITETIVREVDGGLSITVGRVFNVPVHGSMERADLRATPDSSQMFLNLPLGGGDRSQPMMLVYDIRPESDMTDPTDIRMAPSR